MTSFQDGFMDLRKTGEKMSRQALATKLMENLQLKGVGTNEIESQAWDRVKLRNVKNGNIKKAKEIRNGIRSASDRDVKYARGITNLRKNQA